MAANVIPRKGKRGVTYTLVVHHKGRTKKKSFGRDKLAATRQERLINAKIRAQSFGIAEPPTSPTLREFTADYLAHRIGHLSKRQQRDRHSKFSSDGPILAPLGELRISEITGEALVQWVETSIELKANGEPRSRTTIAHYVNALAAALRYAQVRGLMQHNPMPELRLMLSEERNTKAGRAARRSKVSPIEAEDLARLLQAARGAHQEWVYPVVLTLLDTGARLGEARGLCWSQVGWGDDLGRGRHLLIDRSIPSGLTSTEETKSGYIRKVQLSKRLRAALLERYVEQGQPSAESRVFPSFNGDNFRRRQWADICGKKGAGIGHRQIKDLRDSYASLLLSAGIPLAFVSKQLGHQSMQLTERHYARYMPDGDEYQAPEPLARGEVPADLLARLPERAKRPKTSQIPETLPTGTERG